jgi:GrpB-like predicted nucleotidyltransferase (UPF0157 family)
VRARRPKFQRAEIFASAAAREFERHRRRIVGRVPDADIHHVGGTSIPDALTKGDLDIQVRVSRTRFAEVAADLRRMYRPRHVTLWNAEFATFSSPSKDLPEDTAISLVVTGTRFDRNGTFVWSRLAADPDLLARYNALKRKHEGKSWSAYEAEKGEFLSQVAQAENGPISRH